MYWQPLCKNTALLSPVKGRSQWGWDTFPSPSSISHHLLRFQKLIGLSWNYKFLWKTNGKNVYLSPLNYYFPRAPQSGCCYSFIYVDLFCLVLWKDEPIYLLWFWSAQNLECDKVVVRAGWCWSEIGWGSWLRLNVSDKDLPLTDPIFGHETLFRSPINKRESAEDGNPILGPKLCLPTAEDGESGWMKLSDVVCLILQSPLCPTFTVEHWESVDCYIFNYNVIKTLEPFSKIQLSPEVTLHLLNMGQVGNGI